MVREGFEFFLPFVTIFFERRSDPLSVEGLLLLPSLRSVVRFFFFDRADIGRADGLLLLLQLRPPSEFFTLLHFDSVAVGGVRYLLLSMLFFKVERSL